MYEVPQAAPVDSPLTRTSANPERTSLIYQIGYEVISYLSPRPLKICLLPPLRVARLLTGIVRAGDVFLLLSNPFVARAQVIVSYDTEGDVFAGRED